MNEIYTLKQQIAAMRQAIWPQKDMINTLEKDLHKVITPEVREYIGDLYEHAEQITEVIEIFREMISDALGFYLSASSNKTNQVMQILTIFASIFIPLTFIAGIYGMNFKNLPGMHSRWGHIGVFMAMIALAAFMLIMFIIFDWF